MDAETPNPKQWEQQAPEEKDTWNPSRAPRLHSGEDWPDLPSSKPASSQSIPTAQNQASSPWANSPWAKATPDQNTIATSPTPDLTQPVRPTTPNLLQLLISSSPEPEAPITVRRRSPFQVDEHNRVRSFTSDPAAQHAQSPPSSDPFSATPGNAYELLKVHHPTPVHNLGQTAAGDIDNESEGEGEETATPKTPTVTCEEPERNSVSFEQKVSPSRISKDEKLLDAASSIDSDFCLKSFPREQHSDSVTSGSSSYLLREQLKVHYASSIHFSTPTSLRFSRPQPLSGDPAHRGDQKYQSQPGLLIRPFHHQYPSRPQFYSPHHASMYDPLADRMPSPQPLQKPLTQGYQHARSSSMSVLTAPGLIHHLQNDLQGTAEKLQARCHQANQLETENESLKQECDYLNAELEQAIKLNVNMEEKLIIAQNNHAHTLGIIKTLQAIEYNKAKQIEMLITEVNRLNHEVHSRDTSWQIQQLPLPERLVQDLHLEDIAVAATATRFGSEAELNVPCYICNGIGHMSDGECNT